MLWRFIFGSKFAIIYWQVDRLRILYHFDWVFSHWSQVTLNWTPDMFCHVSQDPLNSVPKKSLEFTKNIYYNSFWHYLIKIQGYCSYMNGFRCSFVGGCSGTVRHVRCCFPRCLKAPDISFFLRLVLEIFSTLALNKKCSVSWVTASAELKTRYKFSIMCHTLWTPGRNGTVFSLSYPSKSSSPPLQSSHSYIVADFYIVWTPIQCMVLPFNT